MKFLYPYRFAGDRVRRSEPAHLLQRCIRLCDYLWECLILDSRCWIKKKRFLGSSKDRVEDFTGSTDLDFLPPALLNYTITYGPVNKPAELPCLEFPGWTVFLLLRRTFLNHPARLLTFMISFPGDQKIELPFGVSRHPPPTLLVAVYRFDRGPEQLGHLGLRLVQFFAELNKFFAFQRSASRNTTMIYKKRPHIPYYFVAFRSTKKSPRILILTSSICVGMQMSRNRVGSRSPSLIMPWTYA